MSESTGKHRRKVGIGYSVPASITLLTLIAELALGRCAWGKPRFGEESCFFAGIHFTMHGRGENISNHEKIPTSDNTGKVVWFYAPIAIMLLLNTLGCVQIVRLLCANENRKLQLHLREPKKRHEKMDR